MYEYLKDKKLLVIGADVNDMEIVRTAQSMGVYTIVVDWTTDHSKSPAKLIADEAWDMNYRDVNAIVQKCKEENIDGIMAGYSERRVLLAAKISELLGKPFYATEQIMKLTMDKRKFKEMCMKFNVPVPKEFCTDGIPSEKDISSIVYPVIVKPADYGGRFGITICENKDELMPAVEKALSFSENKSVVIEEYISGVEMSALYILADGEIELALVDDKFQVINNGKASVLCNVAVAPSRNLDIFLKTVDPHIRDFLRGINAKNGMAFFQMIVGKKGIRVFEMGYRLNGGNDCHIIEKFNGINPMKMMISYSLSGHMGDDIKKSNPAFNQYIVTFIFNVRKGVVGKVEYSRLKNFEEIFSITQKVFTGNTIEDDGTTRQQGLVVKMQGSSIEEIVRLLEEVQRCVIIEDVYGNSLAFERFDVGRLLEYYAN